MKQELKKVAHLPCGLLEEFSGIGRETILLYSSGRVSPLERNRQRLGIAIEILEDFCPMEIIKSMRVNMSCKQIAEKIGVNAGVVSYWFRNEGVRMKTKAAYAIYCYSRGLEQ